MWRKKQLIVTEGKKDASRKVLQLSVGSSVPKGHGRSWGADTEEQGVQKERETRKACRQRVIEEKPANRECSIKLATALH